MIKRLGNILLSVGMLAGCLTAQAVESTLYRDGQPPTLTSPAAGRAQQLQSRRTELLEAFRGGYGRAGKPKIALFWNRELSDEVTSTQTAAIAAASIGARPRDNYSLHVKFETTSGPAKVYSLASPPRAAEFEAGFQSSLREAGVVFVDRSAIVRIAALQKAKAGEQSKSLDYQTLEMSALADYAQYLAEVTFIRDVESTGGLEARVTLISTSTGEVVADIVPVDLYKIENQPKVWTATEAGLHKQPAGVDTQWIADESGFRKTSRSGFGIEEGRSVAFALMDQWLRQLP